VSTKNFFPASLFRRFFISPSQFTYFALRNPPPNQIGTRFARALSPFGQPLLSKGLGRLWIFCLSGPASYPKDRGCRNLPRPQSLLYNHLF